MLLRALAGAALAVLVPGLSPGAGKEGPRRLSPADQADVARVEEYLNALKTLSARFLQVAPSGEALEGTIYLSRPGRMRIEYDPPSPTLLIAGRGMFIHYDSALKSVIYLPLDATPVGVLLREPVELAGEVSVHAVERGPGSLRLTLVQTKDLRAGKLTLVFHDRPLALANWQVTDAQGAVTRVALIEPRAGVSLDPALFQFVDPNFPR
ncbi:MAG: LolA family protein [Pseudomonadota bacterium]